MKKQNQVQQFQILIEDCPIQQHKRKSSNFQILEEQNAQSKQSYTIDMEDRKLHRSIIVSMVQDDDLIHNYFLSNISKRENHNNAQTQQKIGDFAQKVITKPKSKETADKKSDNTDHSSQQTEFTTFDNATPQSTHNNKKIIAKNSQTIQSPPNQTSHSHTSRLALQKQKYNLYFEQVYGQIFIYIAECSLIGLKKQEYGLFLLTNYRFIFFKDLGQSNQTKKRVDLPFGFVKNIQYTLKRKQIVFHLHYSHYWKFSFEEKDNYDKIKIMLQLYAKVKDVKSSFAFSYALRYPYFKKTSYQILKEYVRMSLAEVSLVFPNESFKLSDTYPPYICLPQALSQGSRQSIKSICQNFKCNRLPILSFRYGVKSWSGLWLSGTYVQDNKVNQKQLKAYFSYIRDKNNTKKFHVYDCYFKSAKAFNESSLDSKIQNHYMNLSTNMQIKTSYNLIVQAYLTPKSSFFADVIQSKWYQIVLKFLQNSFQISQKLMMQQSVLIKQDQMREKSLIVSALIQLILEPFYRTFKGITNLIMKEFVCFGFKFASRIGNKQPEQQCATFLVFLDAVSQLIYLNPLCFQYNSKYLSKLSNLMNTNIFGTFLADSPKQFFELNLLEETVQVWVQLQNDLTKNAFYQVKSGALGNKPHRISDLRFWLEHFSYLTGQPKDIYKIHPLAQTNTDYTNLECLKLKTQNKKLKSQIQKQREQIKRMQQKAKNKQKKIQQK